MAKARRTVLRSSTGKKLYAVRDKAGKKVAAKVAPKRKTVRTAAKKK